MKRPRICGIWAGAALLAELWTFAIPASAFAQTNEYRVKAGYLPNFARFVEWPEDSFRSKADAVQVCLLGPNSFGTLLVESLRGQTIDNRRFEISFLTDAARVGRCHILYVTSGGTKKFQSVLQIASIAPVLTIGETEGFEGVVTLKVTEGRIRIEINTDAASRVGLKISSKLLNIAHLVTSSGDRR